MAKKKAPAGKKKAAAGPAAARPAGWLVKTEPSVYPWARLVADGRTCWDGVLNYPARNHLSAMRVGERAFYYHPDEERSAVGLVEVVREGYPDPTADDPRWVAVDVAPVAALRRPVTLAAIKADPALQEIALVKQGRLSVLPLDAAAFARILQLGGGLAE